MVTRRQFLGAAAVAPALAAQSRPNVLFLSVDDMNDWVGCLRGYPGVSTPNIDRLAKRGVLFANAHCAAPLCSPSRTALFTGLSPATSGIYNNDQYWRPALPDAVTIPQYFMRNGYHVAGAGKILHHVVGYNPPDQWHEFKLQVFDDPWYRRPEWYPWNKKEPVPPGHPYNGIKDFQRQPPVPAGEFDWGVLPKAEAEYGDEKAVEFAGEFLGRRHAKPFFLAIGLWHPHIPMFAPQKYFDLYPEKRVRLPEGPADDLDDVPLIGRQFAAARQERARADSEGGQVARRRARLPGQRLIRRCHGGAGARHARPQPVREEYDRSCSIPTTGGIWGRSSTGTSPRCGSDRRTCRSSWRGRGWRRDARARSR